MASILGKSNIEIKLFLLFFFIYSFMTSSFTSSGNEWSRFALTKSFVDYGTFSLNNLTSLPYIRSSEWGDCVEINGHLYSNKAPGLLFITAPAYLITKLLQLEKLAPYDKGRPYIQEWAITILTTGIISALLVVLVYKFSRLFVSGQRALLTSIVYGLATPALPWSTTFFNHQLEAFLSFASFYFLFRSLKLSYKNKEIVSAGVLSGIFLLVNYVGFFIILLFFLYFILLAPNRKGILLYILPSIICAILFGYYNHLTTGNIFLTTVQVHEKNVHSEIFRIGWIPRNLLRGLILPGYGGFFIIAQL